MREISKFTLKSQALGEAPGKKEMLSLEILSDIIVTNIIRCTNVKRQVMAFCSYLDVNYSSPMQLPEHLILHLSA